MARNNARGEKEEVDNAPNSRDGGGSSSSSDGKNLGDPVVGIDVLSKPAVGLGTGIHRPSAGGTRVDSLRPGQGAARITAPNDDRLAERCPFLWEILTLDRYSDDTVRILPEVVIRRLPGAYEVTLRDHASRQSKSVAFLEAASLWDALEAALSDPTRPWRPYDSYLNPDPLKAKQNEKKRG
jgi:hypothetical protein